MNLRTLTYSLILLAFLGCTSSKQVALSDRAGLELANAETNQSLESVQEVSVTPGEIDNSYPTPEAKSFKYIVKQREVVLASAESGIIPVKKSFYLQEDSCDVIILKSGDEIQAKVMEVGTSEIKYKRCDNLEGPVIVIKKSTVFMIRYPNGSKTVMEEEKKDVSSALGGDTGFQRNQLVAVLLAFFLGVLGIHRFYLGYIGAGVIQLLTAGGCGIWALIDFIRILLGDLKPKDGDYDFKF